MEDYLGPFGEGKPELEGGRQLIQACSRLQVSADIDTDVDMDIDRDMDIDVEREHGCKMISAGCSSFLV